MDLLRKIAVEQSAAIIAMTHDAKIFDRFDKSSVSATAELESEAAVECPV